jgi:hypothetical protein
MKGEYAPPAIASTQMTSPTSARAFARPSSAGEASPSRAAAACRSVFLRLDELCFTKTLRDILHFSFIF